ncbi:NPCBM/NEW2 domain-containing protein [Plantactinospora sp. GCM10030261]|uniref:NPCBM/NEW2 domain-containing protein n=1 Tax=Plantactinospora sp. GCM10030261 TaxID=3273420 RepID=UPI00361118DF
MSESAADNKPGSSPTPRFEYVLSLVAIAANLAGVLQLFAQKWLGGLFAGIIAIILGGAGILGPRRRARRQWVTVIAVLVVALGGIATGMSASRLWPSLFGADDPRTPAAAGHATRSPTPPAVVPSGSPSAGPPQSSPSAADRPSFVDLQLAGPDDERSFEAGSRKVNAETYEDAYAAKLLCYVVGSAAQDEYQVDRQYQRFTAKVGLADAGSASGIQVRFSVSVDGKVVRSVVATVGEIKTIDVPVTGALRMSLRAEIPDVSECGGEALATWVEPRLT